MNKSEAKIQQEIYLYYHNSYCLPNHNPRGLIFSVPNESSSVSDTIHKKNIGLLPGTSDLIICKPCGELVFVEVKDHKGRQSPKQIDFQQRVTKLGFRYILVRSLEDFITQLAS